MLTLVSLRNGLADAVRDAAGRSGLGTWAPAAVAPATLADVIACQRATGCIVVWSGASDACVFDERSNWLFRAWHDSLHVRTGIGFTPAEERELAKVQCIGLGDELARLVQVEVAGQATYYERTGLFVGNQVAFTLEAMR